MASRPTKTDLAKAEAKSRELEARVFQLESVLMAQAQADPAAVLAMKSHEGPLPSPETMEGYAKFDPLLPSIIVSEFQKEGDSRRELQRETVSLAKKEQSSRQSERSRGQWMAFSAAAAILGCGILAMHLGYPWVAGVCFSGFGVQALMSMIGVSKASNKKVDEENAQAKPEN